MQGHLYEKSPKHPLERSKERRRATLLLSFTGLIVILGLSADYYAYHRQRILSDKRQGSTALISTQGNPVVAVHAYRFSSIDSSNGITGADTLPPNHIILMAASLSQAIETFAKRYFLTVDSVENNDVSYITRNGLQIRTQVSLAKNGKIHIPKK